MNSNFPQLGLVIIENQGFDILFDETIYFYFIFPLFMFI